MKQDTKLLMVLIGAVLITSGCMNGGGGEASTEAVSINEFSITPNPSPGGQQATIQMQLENAGSAVATDVRADLFGPTIRNDDPRTWNASDGTTMYFNDLQPATDNQPAIPQQDSLTFRTPELDQGRDLPYDFNAQLFYGYETTASTSLQVMSQERYQESGSSQQQTSASNSDGPIQIDVQGSTPIVFQSEQGERTQDLCITVTNRGNGLPFNPGALPAESSSDIEDDDRNNIELEIEDVGNIIFTPQDDGEHSNEDETGVVTTVDIIGNEGFHCFTMTAASLGDVTTLEQTANIEIDARYGYREETSTSVTVEGRGTSSTSSGETETGSGSSESVSYEWSSDTPSSISEGEDADDYCNDDSQPQNLRDEYCVEK